MNVEQFERACRETVALLKRLDPELKVLRQPEHETRPGHLAWMLVEAGLFYHQGKIEKANRWLGFVQGSMAADGYATVEELKRANMPEGAEYEAGRV